MVSKEVIVEVKNLKKYFSVESGYFFKKEGSNLKAVDGLNFNIKRGETLGLVGESGCGKSTTGRTILMLYHPTDGNVIFEGEDITKLNNRQLQKKRRKMQMIFQDPYSSLNPRSTVNQIILEPIEVHKLYRNKKESQEKVKELLKVVGLDPNFNKRYPNEFSGGQRQRIAVARALAADPDFIVCDEPISALDVSIQAQIINLLQDLKINFNLTYLFISHDLSVVRYISDRIAVMYLGKLVELGESNTIYENPLHPYTQALLSAVPVPNPTIENRRERIILKGDIPSPINPPKGCVFNTRCSESIEICYEKEPELKDYDGNGHWVACHLYQ